MKVFFTSLLALLCGAVLILGQNNWNKKTIVAGKENIPTENASVSTTSKAKRKTIDSEKSIDEILALANNWPEVSKQVLKKHQAANSPFTILIAGSTTLGDGGSSWPEKVKKMLLSSYGEGIISVEIKKFDMTSSEFANADMQKELNADMIIFEPFTLNDNGVVAVDDSLNNIKSIMQDVQSRNDSTQFILTPPHPLYKAKHYPVQVEELKNFSKVQGIIYLDHWQAWPDFGTDTVKEFLTEDQSEPSLKGHEVWATFINNFLVNR